MPWIQINATVPEHLVEPLSDVFMDANAASVTFIDAEDQPIFEPEIGTTPVWSLTKVTALYDAEVDSKPIIEFVKNTLPEVSSFEFKTEALEDKDWVRAWMENFKPMQFGQNLWIVPSTMQAPNPNATNLILDPGLAFGTGTHPTTALCLTWLDGHAPKNQTVIDYGCGSGILALAAQKLGAVDVWGTDIDPQAITASIDNAQRNQSDMTFALVANFNPPLADTLLANILAGPLKELAPEFSRLLKPQGTLILSGLLTTQAADLIEFYQTLNFKFVEQMDNEDWSLLCFTRI